MSARRSDEELLEAARAPSFTPGARDRPGLFRLLETCDERSAEVVMRALARAPAPALTSATERFEAAEGRPRARLCELVGRIAKDSPSPDLRAWLERRLEDPAPLVRRRAARSLAKLGDSASETPLLAALAVEQGDPEKKAMVDALGRLGSRRSGDALSSLASGSGELGRVAREALQRLDRAEARALPSRIDADAEAPGPVPVLLHVRAGLEPVLLSELADELAPRISGRGRVAITLVGRLSRLWHARTFLHFGFPLPPVEIGSEQVADVERAVADALTGEAAARVFETWTRGPVRWRLEWAGGGHRRAVTLRVARAVAEKRPELVNDPREAPWQAVVHEGPGVVRVELWPRRIDDPRFTWRLREVPAASHPTVAAALARVGGVRSDDVVWDPFVGAGAELVERALLGPYARLIGTDTSEEALAAARANLAMAKVRRVELQLADARTFEPKQPVTLILTNPPMGRRARAGHEKTGELLTAVLTHAAERLAPRGRIVWLSPLPSLTWRVARDVGLLVCERRRVDMGGFAVELQVFERQ